MVTGAHGVDRRDEGRHPPGPEDLWNESYYADFVTDSGDDAGYVRLGLYPNLGVSWWTVMVVRPGEDLVGWTDYELPVPGADKLQLQARGTELTVEARRPLEELSIRAKGVGRRYGRPEAVYEGLADEEVELAFDLSWVTDGSPYHYVLTTRYEVPCVVSGRLRIGEREVVIAGVGQRDHSWGVRDWWSHGWCWASARLDDGTRIHVTDVRLPGRPPFGYVQSADGVTEVSALAVAEELGAHGLARSARIGVEPGGIELTVHPMAYGPLLLRSTDGRLSRFPRAVARFRAADGRSGLGWIEWNQPLTTA